MSEIGELIRKTRQRSRLSQRALARRAGTSQAAISRIERGLEEPTFERTEQILAGLGWRPVVELEPIAEHDEEPRRLYEGAEDPRAVNLARGLSLSRFAATLDRARPRKGGRPLTDAPGRKPADQEGLLRALVSNEVDFLVLGGIAVYIHGYVRLTEDVDVLPDPSTANMRRLAEVLAELGAVAVGTGGVRLDLDLSHPESLALGNHFLDTKLGALDLVNGPRPDLKRYRRLLENSIEVELEGVIIRVIGKDDLIDMKREAGRDKDLRDIAALTEVERAGGPEAPSDDR